MVQPCFTRGANVHRRSKAYGLQSFEYLDTPRIVIIEIYIFACHMKFSSSSNVRSDPHRHDDVPVVIIFRAATGPHLACALGITEMKCDRFLGYCLQKIEEILRIEPDFHFGSA